MASSSSSKRHCSTSADRTKAALKAVESNLLEYFEKDDPLVASCLSIVEKMPTTTWLSFSDVLLAIQASIPNMDSVMVVNAAACISRKRGVHGNILKGSFKWVGHLPNAMRVVQCIGSGLTSNVYCVDWNGGKFALKVPKAAYSDLKRDIKYLGKLEGIDGIPRVDQCIHSMLLMEPVGEPFTPQNLAREGTDVSVASLVEILQCAHRRNIVNRDVRQENIMIAKSLQTGEYRPYILDWGFANEGDATDGEFCGSMETASYNVLQQYILGKEHLSYTAADDLTSLVRCLFLFFNHDDACELHKVGKDAEALLQFWKMKEVGNLVWQEAHRAAQHLEYETLKSIFQQLQVSYAMSCS